MKSRHNEQYLKNTETANTESESHKKNHIRLKGALVSMSFYVFGCKIYKHHYTKC